jgi:hypothetical protein
MAAGVTEHLWEMSGIVALWEAVEPKAAPERDVDMSRAQHDALDLQSHEIAVAAFPLHRPLMDTSRLGAQPVATAPGFRRGGSVSVARFACPEAQGWEG